MFDFDSLAKKYYSKYRFYDIMEKRIRCFFFYSAYDQLKKEFLTFKHESNECTISFSNDLKTITKSFEWRRQTFHPRLLYRNLNGYYLLYKDKFYVSQDWTRTHEKYDNQDSNFDINNINYIYAMFLTFFRNIKRPTCFNSRKLLQQT